MDVTSAEDLNCSLIRTNPSNIISSSTSSPLLDPSRQTAVISSNKNNRNRKCHPYNGNGSRKGKGPNGKKRRCTNNSNLNMSEVTAKELLAAASLLLNQKQSQSGALSHLLSTMDKNSLSNLVCSGSSHVHPSTGDGDCRCSIPLNQGIIHSVPVVCTIRMRRKNCLLWSWGSECSEKHSISL